MTAISAAMPVNTGAISTDPALSSSGLRGNTGRQVAFSSMLSSVPGDEDPSAPASKTSSKKDDKEDNGRAVVAPVLQAAQPRILLPLTLQPASGTQEWSAASQITAGSNTPALPAPAADEIHLDTVPAREVAFAVKLLEATPAAAPHIPNSSNSQAGSPARQISSASKVETAIPTRAARTPATTNPSAVAPPAAQKPDAFKAPAPRAQAPRPASTEPQPRDSETQEPATAAQPREHLNTAAPAPAAAPEPPAPAPPAHPAEPAAPSRIIEPTHLDAAPANTPAKDISLQINAPDRASASIRIVEAGSELRVAVRASDTQLAETLRGGVDQLTSRLNSGGWNTEVWHPAAIPASAAVQQSESQMQQRQGSGDPSPSPFPNRDRNNSNQQQQQRPEWVEEFDLCK